MTIPFREKLKIFLLLFLFFTTNQWAQDSIPILSPIKPVQVDTVIASEVDTLVPVVVDTIVIRRTQYKIKIIPRGVELTNPVISFNDTDPLLEKPSHFVIPSFWVKENQLGINISEVAFVNWNAGGENAISGTGKLKFVRNYKFRHIQWDNDLEFRYGLVAQEGREPRKTDDAIRLNSQFGYRQDTLSPWYFSAKGKFNTQFTNGFNYPDRETPVSTFMAPGYLFIGGGASYIPEGKKFNLYISPASFKTTFVLDQQLANKGSFGVKRAILDDNGNIIREGEKSFSEFGILVTNNWEKEIAENVLLIHKVSLYTDYLRSFGNIDIDWELNFKLRVNNFLQAEIGGQLIYDDDIRFDQVIDDNGTVIDEGEPRIQIRQYLNIGVVFDF